jgi:glycosyltransferase involved in cell wall biosynthesis
MPKENSMAPDATTPETKKTIAFIITRHSEYGGAQIHVRDLAKMINDRGHRAVILTGAKGFVAEDAENLGVEVIEVPSLVREIHPLKDIKAIYDVARVLRRISPDLVSTHSSKAGIIGRVAAKLCKIPAIFTAHGWAFTDGISERKRKVYTFAEKLCAPLAAKIITVSEFDQKIALLANVCPKDKMVAIHNGMPDIELPERVARNPGDPLRLVMIARFSPQKNHALLISALSTIRDRNWTLTLAGGGDDSVTKMQAKIQKIDHKINFLGERRDVPNLLAAADAFCLISNWEGFPRAIIEAKRAGLPVITSDAGGSAEAIEEGETGYVVGKDARGSIAESISKLIDDPERVERMGAAARARYERLFTFDRMAERTFEVYDEILNNGAPLLAKAK